MRAGSGPEGLTCSPACLFLLARMQINPFEPYNDYFSREREIMPIVDMPEPKSRFTPSKWEEKK